MVAGWWPGRWEQVAPTDARPTTSPSSSQDLSCSTCAPTGTCPQAPIPNWGMILVSCSSHKEPVLFLGRLLRVRILPASNSCVLILYVQYCKASFAQLSADAPINVVEDRLDYNVCLLGLRIVCEPCLYVRGPLHAKCTRIHARQNQLLGRCSKAPIL
ncbi:hypothetical protein M378DRAFT_964529 [Amanita muscaria Koide BX008]|uniref:Uncharacterized protein n=1 Tax=Amanita muscaria (strain Koide BX008) TaxID=946122 RepID=A0A0C2T0B9_AMAMK|nr:hypothetical protein M378DRAFT_964529 [Amanita muscaria Koide BX008]